MRASRMMALLLHLQVREQLTVRELAERLEVSERTIMRDVQALVFSGAPIQTVRGPNGGYRLENGYRTRLTGLAAEEAQALAFLSLTDVAGQLGLQKSLRSARTKLWAAMTGGARERAERTEQRFHVDPVRWYGTSEPTPYLTEVSNAIWLDRRLRFGYRRGDQTADRTVDPLGLVLAAGEWYLVAARDEQLRTYRVSRLITAQLLDDPARRPVGFSLPDAWAASRRDLERRHELIEVTVRVQSQALPKLRRLVAVSGQSRIDVTHGDSEVELTVTFETESWACTALLGLGSQVEVLAPASLRAKVASQARAVVATYQSGTTSR